MRFSASVIAYFFSINNVCKIHPINNINTNIYHYKPEYDDYRYKSKKRKVYKKYKKYTNLVQDHHIIPKQWKKHKLITSINFDINSSNNLVIMPTPKTFLYFNFNPNIRTHYIGHPKYNIYVKEFLDKIDELQSLDEKKFYFWLFFIYLKENCIYLNNNIPWN
tara:strand:- start:8349 stop:8837 length:489 start_codon:yes stop_codon:yes gene_type:complete